jgi:hypothetical protein
MSSGCSWVRVAIMLILAAAQATVHAATPDPLAVQLKRCVSLTDASARLACYDALAGLPPSATTAAAAPTPVAGGSQAGTSSSATVAASGAPPAPPAEEFGVHNGPLEVKRGPVREKRMLAVVSTVSNRANGELVVRLDNGQVWVQLEPNNFPVKPGDHVEIDVGAFGSYVLWSPSNRRATKVDRVD